MATAESACTFPECGRRSYGRPLCPGHVKQQRKGRELTALKNYIPRSTVPAHEVFWDFVEMGEGCWEWTGPRISGYGEFRDQRAHRVAYEMKVGQIPAGMQIDHKCRNRACVNPAHLHAVTNKVNHENLGVNQNNSSGYRGVSYHAGKWTARVVHNGKAFWGGRHTTVEGAHEAAVALRNRLYTNNLADQA